LLALSLLLSGSALAGDAPDFSLRNTENDDVKLSEFEGQVVLLSFWATWCVPCQVEMPKLQEMHSELADQGFTVLAISTDDSRSKSRVKPMIKSKGYTFPVLYDTDTKVVTQYNPEKTLPYTVLIDREGNVAYKHSGYSEGDEVHLREEVDKLLAPASE